MQKKQIITRCLQLTKDERSLLLYAETQLVDNYGKLQAIRMNEIDFHNLEKFKLEGLLNFGRLPAKEIMKDTHYVKNTHWVLFSEDAWLIAHQLRRDRAERMLQSLKERRLSNDQKEVCG